MTIEQLKQEIRENIRGNGDGHITGQILQDVLLDITEKLDDTQEMVSRDGEDGVGIKRISVEDTESQGVQAKRLTISLTDGSEAASFVLANGRDGRDGVDGRNGRDGVDGADGEPGQPGKDGLNGVDGRDGRDGQDGKDGVDGRDGAQGAQGREGAQGPQGMAGAQGPAGDGSDTELFEALEEELRRYKVEVSGRLESIRTDIESDAESAVADALERLNLTASELTSLRNKLNSAAQNAQDALALARSLSGATGEIDPEVLAEILSVNQQVSDWINDYSGHLMTLWDEYNASLGYLGRAGIGIDPSKGMIGVMGENINTISGTVGTVKGEWDASKGRIEQMATWYDENSGGSFTSLMTEIDAMRGVIRNLAESVSESAITSCQSYIDVKMAEIGEQIQVSGVDLTYIHQWINGLSGTVVDQIDRQNGLSGSMVTIRRELNATSASLLTYITKANSAYTAANDMRETWTRESGMLRTVSDLVIMEDEDGIPYYYYIDPETGESKRVYYQGKSGDGRTYFTENQDGSGDIYFNNVYPKYMTNVFSYIQQKADSIEMSVNQNSGVTSGQVLAALRLSVESGTSRINMTADRVNIDSDTFVRALSARTANLAGVKFGGGVICGGTPGSTSWAMNGYGDFYAQNGFFKGSISADNGYFSGSVYANDGIFRGMIEASSLKLTNHDNNTIEDYLSGKIASAMTGGMDSEAVNQLITNYVNASGASMGFITNSYFENWVADWNATHPDNKIDANAASAIAKSIFDSEISKVFSSTDENGVTTHTATIGDRTYEWKTVDTGDYLLVDTGLGELSSGGTGGFIVSKDGLVEAYNALIYGKIYASEGYFKGNVSADSGYFRGSISATDGYFKGDIVASAGTIGGVRITEDGLSGANINITNNYFFSDNVAIKGSISADNGYFSGSVYANDGIFRGDVYANNGEFNGAITATSLFLADGAQVDVTPEAIGIDTSQFVRLDSGITGNRGEVLVSRSGLLQAKNAIISGSVYAEDSYFKGTVHATDGDFRGSISATNGYFHGQLVASAGTIGGVTITEDGLSGANINITNNYFFSDNVALKGSISAINGYFSGTVYATDGKFKGNISADSGYFKGTLCAATGTFGGKLTAAEGSFKGAVSATSLWLSDSITIAGTDDEAIHKGEDISGDRGLTYFHVDNNGKLTARNANIKGTICAETGYFKGALCAATGTFGGKLTAAEGSFKGSLSANSGYFKGTLCAATGTFGGKLTAAEGSFKGAVSATSLYLGGASYDSMPSSLSSGDVRNIVGQEANSHGWITTGDGYYKINSPVGDNFKVDTNGLLVANNAILSGSVYATNGVFSGTVYATDGKFKGAVSATTLYLDNNLITDIATHDDVNNAMAAAAAASGWGATDMGDYLQLDNTIASGTSSITITKNGLLMANNAIINGTVFANDGEFRGTVYANDGYFKGRIEATEGEFRGTVRAADIILDGKKIILSGAGNTFEIGNNDITVAPVAETVNLRGASIYNSTEQAQDAVYSNFTATGDSTVFIPEITGNISLKSSVKDEYAHYYAGTLRITVQTYVTSGYGTTYIMQRGWEPVQSYCISYKETTDYVELTTNGSQWMAEKSFRAGFNPSATGTYSFGCKDRNTYTVGWFIKAELVNLETWTSYYTASTTVQAISFTNTPLSTDINFFRIGRNGLQVQFADGFNFTAADRGTDGSVVSINGRKTNGQQFGLRADKNGLMILRGDGINGWEAL